MLGIFIPAALSASLLLTPVSIGDVPMVGQMAGLIREEDIVLSLEMLDLSKRYPVTSVSNGFRENILIALDYFVFQDIVLELKPGEVFAFHKKGILPEFNESKIISQESDFTTNTGYKVVAGLGGNGVCHLASLINKAASKAGLEVTAPVNHNFAVIEGIEREYGTSISTRNSPERQNLYVRNNFDYPVKLEFSLENDLLSLKILRGGLVYRQK